MTDNDKTFDINENLIKVTSYEVLGKLQDPFLSASGKRTESAADWEKRRREIYASAIELQYGTQPPAPEVLRVTKTYSSSDVEDIRIEAGTRTKQVSFKMMIIKPLKVKNPPVVVDGDLCWLYVFGDEYRKSLLERGIAICMFDRTELANDIKNEGRRCGRLYDVYPEYGFGALGAWAWGYSRCADALEIIGGYDLSWLAFSGHSRGAKTAMLAGALDERAKIVNPNESNAGSCSCYRIHMTAIKENGSEFRSERLCDLWKNFGFWLGEGMGEYRFREFELPFDCHFLKALIAPRVLLIGEAASDIWTNPIGSWQTTMAAAEVYKFLGVPERLLWYYRRGEHKHMPQDVEMLSETIKYFRDGEPLSDRYFRTPFPKPELIFDWKAPERTDI
ncbi:MAG: hypothetical protein MJ137_05520 [Clostridia bacterium]|nr:hypothetical protein [Clostridia bacterium]